MPAGAARDGRPARILPHADFLSGPTGIMVRSNVEFVTAANDAYQAAAAGARPR